MAKINNIRWLVVGGCPRSGTSMLNFTLNSHPQIFLANEQNLYKSISISEKIFYREDFIQKRKARKLSIREKNISSYNNERNNATILRKFSHKNLIVELFKSSLIHHTVARDTLYLGDKFPRYYRWDLNAVEDLLGPIKYIHITRSPLSVINSNLFRVEMSKQGQDWINTSRTLYDCISDWIEAWNFACWANERLDFLHLCYEDVIAKPQTEFKYISEFLGIEQLFNTSMISQTTPGREFISDKQINIIQKYIPEDLLDWQTSFEELINKYSRLEFNYNNKNYLSRIKRRLRSKLKALYHTSDEVLS